MLPENVRRSIISNPATARAYSMDLPVGKNVWTYEGGLGSTLDMKSLITTQNNPLGIRRLRTLWMKLNG
jgi:hypothetical protein